MSKFKSWIPVMLLILAAGAAPGFAKPKPPAPSQLQAQLKKVTAERDELKERLGATENLQQDLAAAQKSRDMARAESAATQKELEQMKAALTENQGSADTILSELQKAKSEAAASREALEALRRESTARKDRLAAPTAEGALVPISPEITPAKPLNLNRITPKAKKVSGVVVVNVLISEAGEVLDTRLLQGLQGEGEWVDKANAACVEAAKRIVFDPARAADAKTRVRVWQGVGFFLN